MKKIFTLALLTTIIACGNAQNNTEGEQTPTVKNLAQEDLADKIADDSVIVIDVRTPAEVKQFYIKGADMFIDINGDNFEAEIDKLDKSKTYVMYCRSGGRSGRAANIMVNKGFEDVYNLEGGITDYKGELGR